MYKHNIQILRQFKKKKKNRTSRDQKSKKWYLQKVN